MCAVQSQCGVEDNENRRDSKTGMLKTMTWTLGVRRAGGEVGLPTNVINYSESLDTSKAAFAPLHPNISLQQVPTPFPSVLIQYVLSCCILMDVWNKTWFPLGFLNLLCPCTGHSEFWALYMAELNHWSVLKMPDSFFHHHKPVQNFTRYQLAIMWYIANPSATLSQTLAESNKETAVRWCLLRWLHVMILKDGKLSLVFATSIRPYVSKKALYFLASLVSCWFQLCYDHSPWLCLTRWLDLPRVCGYYEES